jgi:imidazolonepropionase-like amidohydrolase
VRLILLGGYDAPLCKELLKKHNVSVIVSAVQRRPMRRSEPYEMPYTLPARLAEAGIPFCISCNDRSSTWNTRNLPIHAAMASAWGLDRNEALRSVTLYPAQILGVDDRVGSLEVGKDATLFVADGDALEISTRVSHAWIQGRPVDLNNRHKRLYEKYRQKYEQLGTVIIP